MRKMLPCLLLSLLSCGDGKTSAPEAPSEDEAQALNGDAERSGSRLKVVLEQWDGEDGSRVKVRTNRFYDTKLDVDCSFRLAEDGVRRCLPDPELIPFEEDSWVQGGVFADASCTQSILQDSCNIQKFGFAVVQNPGGTCGRAYKVYKVGSPMTATDLYRNSGTSCTPLSATERANYPATIYPTTYFPATEFVKGAFQRVVLP